jgi:hypothetical protein
MTAFDGKFHFRETFMNSDGKTSGSGFVGVMLSLVAGAAFIAIIVGWFLKMPNCLEMMSKTLELLITSSALLGVRKIAPTLMRNNNVEKTKISEETVNTSKPS